VVIQSGVDQVKRIEKEGVRHNTLVTHLYCTFPNSSWSRCWMARRGRQPS
jgi:hypothetical protein